MIAWLCHHLPLIGFAGWVKFSDDTPWHHKVQPLSDKAHRLWFDLICWCSKNRTGGYFEDANAHALARSRDKKTTRKILKVLQDAGLVDDTSEGLKLHDFEVYHPDDEKTRNNAAKRQQRLRDRRKAEAEEAKRNASRNALRNGPGKTPRNASVTPPPNPNPNPNPNPSFPSSSDSQSGQARSTYNATSRARLPEEARLTDRLLDLNTLGASDFANVVPPRRASGGKGEA